MEKCKNRLPCGWCDRLNDKCVFEQKCESIMEVLDTPSKTIICIHEWEPVNSINTSGYVYRCKKCGARKTEPITRGLQEYITTSDNGELFQNSILESLNEIPDACKNCSSHPSNGGSGNCNCILGSPVVNC